MRATRRSALLVAIALILLGALSIGYERHLTREKNIHEADCFREADANYKNTHPEQVEQCKRETEQNRHAGGGISSDLTKTCIDVLAGEIDETQCRDPVKCVDCLEVEAARASLNAYESGPGGYGWLAVVCGFLILAVGIVDKLLRICLRSAVVTLIFISASMAAICIAAFVLVPKKTSLLAVPVTFLLVAEYFFVCAINRFIHERFGDPQPRGRHNGPSE